MTQEKIVVRFKNGNHRGEFSMSLFKTRVISTLVLVYTLFMIDSILSAKMSFTLGCLDLLHAIEVWQDTWIGV